MTEFPWLRWLVDPHQHDFAPIPPRQYGPCFACGREEGEHVMRFEDRLRRLAELRDRERYGRPGGQA